MDARQPLGGLAELSGVIEFRIDDRQLIAQRIHLIGDQLVGFLPLAQYRADSFQFRRECAILFQDSVVHLILYLHGYNAPTK